MKSLALTGLLVLMAWACTCSAADPGRNRSDTFANSCRKAIDLDIGKDEPTLSDALSIADCYGYIQGFIDGHNMTADQPGNTKEFCIPDGVAVIQIARLVVKASDDRPDIGHYHRESLVEYALKSIWPCDASGI